MQPTVHRCPIEDLEAEDQVSLLNKWFDVAGTTIDGDEVELTLTVRYRRGHIATVLPGHAHNQRIQADRIARMQEQLEADLERGVPACDVDSDDRIDLSDFELWPSVQWVYFEDLATAEFVIARASDGVIVDRHRKYEDRDAALRRLGGARQHIFPGRIATGTEASA